MQVRSTTTTSATTASLLVANSASTTDFAVFNDGNAMLAGTLAQNSDQRLKTNIQTLDGSSTLALITELDPVTFNWINNVHGSTTQAGFIAQEVQKIFPNLVSTSSPTALTPDGTLGINYIGFISPLIAAVQQIEKQIVALTATVASFADSFTTKVVHTNEICVAKSDGTEFCANGDQLSAMAAAASAGAPAPAADPAPAVPDAPAATTTPDTAVLAPVDATSTPDMPADADNTASSSDEAVAGQ